MSQFAVHRNLNSATRSRFPLLLDVQAEYLSDLLKTRVVVPLLAAKSNAPTPILLLTPEVTIAGSRYLALVPQLAAITDKELGAQVADLSERRTDFIRALDMLLTGH